MKQFRERKTNGFTLAELLVVVAIIAVLTAIAIPVFSANTESAREAYDIHTMRQAATAAIELFQAGSTDEQSAKDAGMLWNSDNNGTGPGTNAYGVYDPKTGTFKPLSSKDSKTASYACGKGTARDGGTRYKYSGDRLAYAADWDYTGAVIMVSIYPVGNNKRVDVYWKYSNKGKNPGKYVGDQAKANDPKYSIRIPLE
jgi:prepilin-type N-terminal cleavage/methylation domain-containing protein